MLQVNQFTEMTKLSYSHLSLHTSLISYTGIYAIEKENKSIQWKLNIKKHEK